MAKNKKKRVSARAKSSIGEAVHARGLRRFRVIFSADELPKEVLATDEEDAAERTCSKWEVNLDSVQVIDLEKQITYRVSGAREDGDWHSHGAEVLGPQDEVPPPVPEPLKPANPPAWPAAPVPDLQCSFCGKQQREVKKLIAGPSIYICDECISLSVEICLEDGLDIVKAAKEELDEEGKRAEREAAAEKAKTARIAAARTVLAELEEKGATTHLGELKKLLGDETYTKEEMREFAELADEAQRAKLSIADYVTRLKRRIALHERLSKSAIWDGMLGYSALAAMLGMGAMYAMGSRLGERKPK